MEEIKRKLPKDYSDYVKVSAPGNWAAVMSHVSTKKLGLCDFSGNVICPCICDSAYTSIGGVEIGVVEYNGLSIQFRFVDKELAKSLVEHQKRRNKPTTEAYFDFPPMECSINVINTTDYIYSDDEDTIKVAPGVKVSPEYAEARELKPNTAQTSPEKIFEEFIKEMSQILNLLD